MQNSDRTICPRGDIPPLCAALHDLSCFGRCALSVVIPVLSVLGVQPVPMPTALFSTHTGGFEGYSFDPLDGQLEAIIAHYRRLELRFDAVYTGFFGGMEQLAAAGGFIACCRESDPACLVYVDPVMADDGRLYATYTAPMLEGMRRLAAGADLITPNVTEACILLGCDYTPPPHSAEQTEHMARQLLELGPRMALITGVQLRQECKESNLDTGESIGVVYARRDAGGDVRVGRVSTPRVPQDYPGTGDLFGSVLLGLLLRGASLGDAVKTAAGFVHDAAAATYAAGTEPRCGVLFETMLGQLTINK